MARNSQMPSFYETCLSDTSHGVLPVLQDVAGWLDIPAFSAIIVVFLPKQLYFLTGTAVYESQRYWENIPHVQVLWLVENRH